MKESQLRYARYAQKANKSVMALLDTLSPAAREAGRKSYYGNLGALFRHLIEGTAYMHGLIRASQSAFSGHLPVLEGFKELDEAYGDAQWNGITKYCEKADQATVDFVAFLAEKDFTLPVKLDWYDGKPESVPLYFILDQMTMHGTHHRGQISQILDELGIEHDFSGIDVEFLS